jgi:O-antigen ligase
MAGVWHVATLQPPQSARSLSAMRRGAVIALAGLLAGGAERLPGGIVDRLGSIGQTTVVWDVADAEVDDASFATVERVAHWQAAAAMWADAPWLGHGPGQFERLYHRYRLPRWPDALGHAHNYYLHLLAEVGLSGLSMHLAFLAAAAVFAVRRVLAPRTVLQGALALGVVGVLAATAAHSLTDNLYVHDMTVHLGLLLGLTAAAGEAA